MANSTVFNEILNSQERDDFIAGLSGKENIIGKI